MEIKIANDELEKLWDAYVEQHPLATPYHLFAWKNAVERAYGHRGYYLVAVENNTVCGVLPLIAMKFFIFAKQLVSLPFCDIAGVLADNEQIYQELLHAAVNLAQDLNLPVIDLREAKSNNAGTDLFLTTRTHKIRMLLPLPANAQDLWKNFKSKLRSQIRKAEKNKLRFCWGHLDSLDDFYCVFSSNMRALGSPVHSKKWFSVILQEYRNKALMPLVYYGMKPIGAAIIIVAGNTCYIPWASTSRYYNNLAPNMLLYWNALKHAADNGCHNFDFGRCTPHSPTYKFKRQWQAQPEQLYWHYIGTNQYKCKAEAGPSRKKDWFVYLWQKMPTPLANFLGPRIRKNISL